MTYEHANSGQVYNRDVRPACSLPKAYPQLVPLISNERISEAFAVHEKSAVRAKRHYTWIGRAALAATFTGMVIFAYQVTLGRTASPPPWVQIAGVLLLAAGVFAQLFLAKSAIKRDWLFHRFAAERIRCLKFQAFGLVGSVSVADLDVHVSRFYDAGLARLSQELAGGETAIRDFDPERPLANDGSCPKAVWADSDLRDMTELYDSLRIGVQLQHCKKQIDLADERQRGPLVFSEILLLVGAALAIGDLAWLAARPALDGANHLGGLTSWLHFLTLVVFVSSAVAGVFQRGNTDSADADRYRDYVHELERLRVRLNHSSSSVELSQIISSVEWCALMELKGFARDASRSSYVI